MLNLTVWKVPQYGAFSGPFLSSSNRQKYRPKKNPYLNTF